MPNTETVIKATGSALWWLWLTLVVVVLDQGTKLLVIDHLVIGEKIEILPVLNITHVHNPGAAYGLFRDFGGGQRWGLSAIAVGVSALLLWFMRKTPKENTMLGMSFTLILGGALGNLYDRLAYGYVEDFIDVFYGSHHFPAFNVADSAITVGAMLLILDAMLAKKADEVSSDAN